MTSKKIATIKIKPEKVKIPIQPPKEIKEVDKKKRKPQRFRF